MNRKIPNYSAKDGKTLMMFYVLYSIACAPFKPKFPFVMANAIFSIGDQPLETRFDK